MKSQDPHIGRDLKRGALAIGALLLCGAAISGGNKTAPAETAMPVPVAASQATFGGRDVAAIVQAARTNEARFQRYYQGQWLGYTASFDRNSKTFGLRSVSFDDNVSCLSVAEPAYLDSANWQPGNRVQVLGLLTKVGVLGSVILTECKFSKEGTL